MKCSFIAEYDSGFRVKKMCRTLCVSRSKYYAWKKRSKSIRQQENERLIEKIREAHKLSRRTYGSPRITKELKENNISPVEKTVLPASCGLRAFMPRQNAGSG
jgi:hypothetical protein